ncbi:MAG: metalloregulator ArsR/SmtB family transcription factor [Deltaproteobacteria bacterium]|jgi:ArsR family transcriptional regulator, arsenate/arsenite/antimonite-responsive transcriptional repressor|nr:metalloregulator ArsR/SmtB family transcription factor [Deltaproteobacteria bacterium]
MINPTRQTNDTNHSRLTQDEMARIFKAMGHPIRMQIIQFLKAEKQCFCGELVNRLPLAQSTVSQHLKTLKKAGVIIGTVEGPGTCYCLNRPLLACFKNSVGRFID